MGKGDLSGRITTPMLGVPSWKVAMALQLGALRDALIDAGATTEKAEKAAEEVASYENRLAGIETRLTLLTWMVTFNLAATVALLFKHW